MLTEKDYCDYDTCVALKELKYNRGAYAYYFPNHKEDLIFNTHQMRGCSINEMVKGYNTYPSDVMGHELIDAPTMWEAQKWLREDKKINVFVRAGYLENRVRHYYVEVFTSNDVITLDNNREDYDSYEEALLAGIKEAIKILKEEK